MRAHLLLDCPLVATAIAGGYVAGWPVVACCAGISLGVHAWGVVHPRSSLYLPVHWHVAEPGDGFALTLDDGPDPEQTPRVLDALAEAGAKATFFVIGSHVRRHPQVVRRMVAEGHGLGVHSDSHSHWFNLWPARRVAEDLRACGAAIADAAGIPPPRLFRPPVGLKNPMVGRVAGELGLVCVTWTAGGRDSARRSLEAIERRCRPGLRPGGIILLHDGCDPSSPHVRPHAVPLVRRLLAHATNAGLVARALTIAGNRPAFVRLKGVLGGDSARV